GERCLLPVPRWPRRGGGRGCDLRGTARRLDARPGSDRRRQRARRGDGVHGRAPLPPLSRLPPESLRAIPLGGRTRRGGAALARVPWHGPCAFCRRREKTRRPEPPFSLCDAAPGRLLSSAG